MAFSLLLACVFGSLLYPYLAVFNADLGFFLIILLDFSLLICEPPFSAWMAGSILEYKSQDLFF